MIRTHRPPTTCPVCSQPLITLRLGCPNCATELSGHFDTCRYCRLDANDLQILEVFLRSRGNLRDVQAHLGVSYPTARARLGDVLDRLGLSEPNASPAARPPAEVAAGREAAAGRPPAEGSDAGVHAPGSPSPSAVEQQVSTILAELAAGQLTAAEAEAQLVGLGQAT